MQTKAGETFMYDIRYIGFDMEKRFFRQKIHICASFYQHFKDVDGYIVKNWFFVVDATDIPSSTVVMIEAEGKKNNFRI